MKINRPKISPGLSLKKFDDIFNEEDLLLEVCEISNPEFMNEAVDRVKISDAVIKNGVFTNTHFNHIDLLDVRFEKCDLSNVKMPKYSIHRVEFVDCKLIDGELTELQIGHVTFQRAHLY